MDGGEDLLSDSHNFPYIRQIPQLMSVWMPSGIYTLIYTLESTLKEYQLEDCPGQIYNMDETGMPLDPRPPNIIAKSGQKR